MPNPKHSEAAMKGCDLYAQHLKGGNINNNNSASIKIYDSFPPLDKLSEKQYFLAKRCFAEELDSLSEEKKKKCGIELVSLIKGTGFTYLIKVNPDKYISYLASLHKVQPLIGTKACEKLPNHENLTKDGYFLATRELALLIFNMREEDKNDIGLRDINLVAEKVYYVKVDVKLYKAAATHKLNLLPHPASIPSEKRNDASMQGIVNQKPKPLDLNTKMQEGKEEENDPMHFRLEWTDIANNKDIPTPSSTTTTTTTTTSRYSTYATVQDGLGGKEEEESDPVHFPLDWTDTNNQNVTMPSFTTTTTSNYSAKRRKTNLSDSSEEDEGINLEEEETNLAIEANEEEEIRKFIALVLDEEDESLYKSMKP